MIVKHSEVPVEPESRDRAIAAMKWMAAESRAEAGVIDYRVTADLEAPNVLRIVEQYEDSEAAQSHESSDHLVEFEARIEPCLADDATLTSFEVTEKRVDPGP